MVKAFFLWRGQQGHKLVEFRIHLGPKGFSPFRIHAQSLGTAVDGGSLMLGA